MDRKNSLDSILKAALAENQTEPSRDIFETAWQKRNEEVRNMEFNIKRPVMKVVVAATLCVIFSFAVVLAVSPDLRDSLRTIFVLDRVGDTYAVAEKSENEPIDYWNFGGTAVPDENKAKMEKLLGFEYFIPPQAGQEYTRVMDPLGIITVYGIKLKEAEALNANIPSDMTDENAYKQFEGFDTKKTMSGVYKDSDGNKYYLYLGKAEDAKKHRSDTTVMEELNIEGIQCKIVKAPFTEYHDINGGNNVISDDITRKPIKTFDAYYIMWEYQGKAYSTTNANGAYDHDSLIRMTTEYIKALRAQ